MTKKFVTCISKSGKQEFVVPNIFDKRNCFISIENGKVYEEGIICYTGVDLTTAIVLDKIIENRKLNFFQKRRMKKVLDEYFVQIKSLKISNKVKVDDNSKLVLIKN